jgi:hypothetical protein
MWNCTPQAAAVSKLLDGFEIPQFVFYREGFEKAAAGVAATKLK